MAKRILMPVSSATETAALSLVGGIARDQGSTVRLLRVMPLPERVDGPHGRTIAYVDQEMERLTAEGLDELQLAQTQLAGVPVESVVRFGEPVAEILTEADAFDADLIAVTTDTRSRVKSALTPGVGERVLRTASIPVVLLRG